MTYALYHCIEADLLTVATYYFACLFRPIMKLKPKTQLTPPTRHDRALCRVASTFSLVALCQL